MIHSINHQEYMHSIYEVIAFLLQTTLNFQTFHHIVEFVYCSYKLYKFKKKKFKKLSVLASLIDIRNPFFTRKIKKLNKKLLELKT